MNVYDLTTVAHVKEWLGIPSTDTAMDALLARMVSAQGRMFQAWLSRVIVVKDYTEVRDGSGMGDGRYRMMFNNFPVLSITGVTIDNVPVPASGDGGIFEPGYGFDNNGIWLSPNSNFEFTRGRRNIILQYRAGFSFPGYDNLGAYYDAEAATIPAGSPYTVATQATFLKDLGVSFVSSGTPLVAVTGTPAAGQYKVVDGTYTFNSADASKAISISYSYVPPDLEQACLEMIGVRFKEKDRIGQISKSIAGETVSFTQKDLTDSARMVLQQYKKVYAF